VTTTVTPPPQLLRRIVATLSPQARLSPCPYKNPTTRRGVQVLQPTPGSPGERMGHRIPTSRGGGPHSHTAHDHTAGRPGCGAPCCPSTRKGVKALQPSPVSPLQPPAAPGTPGGAGSRDCHANKSATFHFCRGCTGGVWCPPPPHLVGLVPEEVDGVKALLHELQAVRLVPALGEHLRHQRAKRAAMARDRIPDTAGARAARLSSGALSSGSLADHSPRSARTPCRRQISCRKPGSKEAWKQAVGPGPLSCGHVRGSDAGGSTGGWEPTAGA